MATSPTFIESLDEFGLELLGEDGESTEIVAYADIVSFATLKALAFDQRGERKDAHDLVYCLENFEGGTGAAVAAFVSALRGKHAAVVSTSLDMLRRRFSDDYNTAGLEKDGPVAVARFEIEDDGPDGREPRLLSLGS